MKDEKRPYLGVHMTEEQRATIHKAALIELLPDATWARIALVNAAEKVLKEAGQ